LEFKFLCGNRKCQLSSIINEGDVDQSRMNLHSVRDCVEFFDRPDSVLSLTWKGKNYINKFQKRNMCVNYQDELRNALNNESWSPLLSRGMSPFFHVCEEYFSLKLNIYLPKPMNSNMMLSYIFPWEHLHSLFTLFWESE
jgi:hypothetical protein